VNPEVIPSPKKDIKAKEELTVEEINVKLREEFDRFIAAKSKAKPTSGDTPKNEVNNVNIDDIPVDLDPGDDGGVPPEFNPFLWLVLLIFFISFVNFILRPGYIKVKAYIVNHIFNEAPRINDKGVEVVPNFSLSSMTVEVLKKIKIIVTWPF